MKDVGRAKTTPPPLANIIEASGSLALVSSQLAMKPASNCPVNNFFSYCTLSILPKGNLKCLIADSIFLSSTVSFSSLGPVARKDLILPSSLPDLTSKLDAPIREAASNQTPCGQVLHSRLKKIHQNSQPRNHRPSKPNPMVYDAKWRSIV